MWKSPSVTDAQVTPAVPVGLLTRVGDSRTRPMLPVPSPTWPIRLSPQQYNLPAETPVEAAVTAQVWVLPTETLAHVFPVETSTGAVRLVPVVPSPTWP